jgi:hypothetical protein
VQEEATRENPARVVINEKVYLVYPAGRQWFFQPDGHNDVGWTCASSGLAEAIEKELDADRAYRVMMRRLQKFKGLAPLTPKQAEAALTAMPAMPYVPVEIDRIVHEVTSQEKPHEKVREAHANTGPACGGADDVRAKGERREVPRDVGENQRRRRSARGIVGENRGAL